MTNLHPQHFSVVVALASFSLPQCLTSFLLSACPCFGFSCFWSVTHSNWPNTFIEQLLLLSKWRKPGLSTADLDGSPILLFIIVHFNKAHENPTVLCVELMCSSAVPLINIYHGMVIMSNKSMDISSLKISFYSMIFKNFPLNSSPLTLIFNIGQIHTALVCGSIALHYILSSSWVPSILRPSYLLQQRPKN